MANKKVSLDEAAFAADCALGMYTHEELAAKHGVSASTVGKMVRGQRRPEIGKMIALAREHAAERAKQRVAELLVRAVDVVGGLMNSDRPTVALAAAREMLNRGLGRPVTPTDSAENKALDEMERRELRWLRWRAENLDRWLGEISEDTKKRLMRDLGLTREEVEEASKPQWRQAEADSGYDDQADAEAEAEAEYDDQADEQSLAGSGGANWGATASGAGSGDATNRGDARDERGQERGDERGDEGERRSEGQVGSRRRPAARAAGNAPANAAGNAEAEPESQAGARRRAKAKAAGAAKAGPQAAAAADACPASVPAPAAVPTLAAYRGGGAPDPGPGGMNAERRRRIEEASAPRKAEIDPATAMASPKLW